MENLDELKAIRDSAPEGATHIAQSKCSCRYLKHNVRRDFVYHDGRAFCAFPLKSGFLKTCESIRSLSDINRIIELMEATKGLLQIFGGTPDGYWRNELNAARKALGYKI